MRVCILGLFLAGMVLGMARCTAAALDAGLDVSQYAHTAWKISDGFTKGIIYSIAQTPDGYLWLGTDSGLVRFDGVRAVPWQPPAGEHLPSNDVRRLLVTRDGTLWIGTRGGLASWKDGKLTHHEELTGQLVTSLLEDREATLWVGSSAQTGGRLCAIRNGSVQCFGQDSTFGLGVGGLYEDAKGNLWAGVHDGLWRWKPGPAQFYSLPGNPNTVNVLAEDADGSLLVRTHGGIQRFVDGKTKTYPLPTALPPLGVVLGTFRDGDGSLWIGTNSMGLVRIHKGRTDVFGKSDGLSDNLVYSFFVDREKSIWVATANGLDRFRDTAVATFEVRQGLSQEFASGVLADRDGSVWISNATGLDRWNNGKFTSYGKEDKKLNGHTAHSLLQDSHGRIWVCTIDGVGTLENGKFVPTAGMPGGVVFGIAEDAAGNLWFANRDRGLLRLSPAGDVQQIPWPALGHKDTGGALAADPLQGGLWIGFLNGGVSYFKDGQIRASYSAAEGLAEGQVTRFRFDPDGTAWVSTEGGLSRIKNGRVATLTGKNGLPCDAVHWVIQDNYHAFWLSMACGLVRIPRAEVDAWAAAVDQGKAAEHQVRVTVFNNSDGVRSVSGAGAIVPAVSRASDGRLWFRVATGGVGVVDPKHLPFNKLPPPVYVEQVTGDRKVYDVASAAGGKVRLPALIRDVTIDYTALSLVAPEKVQFRYKLEGWDRDWQEAGTRRQAFYTNLRPGKYRFRVTACNNSGVWNEAGTTLDFAIAPAYYQTRWFQVLCLLAAFLIGWELYRMRVRRVANAISARFDERLAERTRVARELHDTLLQTIQGSKFIADGVLLDPTNDVGRLRSTLEKVSGSLDLAVQEARGALNSLRASTTQRNDLAAAFREAMEECRRDVSMETSLHLSGTTKDMHPVARDEVYRIGFEAIRNACMHSQAKQLDVALTYARDLTLRVRDNGIGMHPVTLDKGKDGHFGLHGMRERAARIGGKLTLVSSQDAGTEMTLLVPGRAIFRKAGASRLEKLKAVFRG